MCNAASSAGYCLLEWWELLSLTVLWISLRRVCRGRFVQTAVVTCSEGTLSAAVKRARPRVCAAAFSLCWWSESVVLS